MNTVPESAATVQFDSSTWTTAVRRVSELAQARLPEALHGRIQRATGLVLAQGVFLDEDGTTCQVRASDGQTWYSANGSCPCTDSQYAPEHLCKHRIARGLYLRASELLREGLPPVSAQVLCETAMPDITTGDTATPPASHVPLQFVVQIQGKAFVKYAGLLAMAHERGLVQLTATLRSVTPELALAEATATFSDGRTFSEAADATPGNVPASIRPHYPRMACTRAKARALRDALNIGICCLEELA